MYCYSIVHKFLEFIHGEWGNLDLNDVRVGLGNIFAVPPQAWNRFTGWVEEEDSPSVPLHVTYKMVVPGRVRRTRLLNIGKEKNENCLTLSPPPVQELIFTKDDIWTSDSASLSPKELRSYSVKSRNCDLVDERKDYQEWISSSAISFSRDVTKSPQTVGSTRITTKDNRSDMNGMMSHIFITSRKDIVQHRSLSWQERQERIKKLWV